MPDPWERLPRETDKAFEAFVAYRNLGPDRTLQRLSEILSKHRMWLGEWKAKWGWEERVAAWDNHLDQLTLKQMERDYLKARKRRIVLGGTMQAVGARRLNQLAETPEELTPNDARSIIVDGVKVEDSGFGKVAAEENRPQQIIDNRRIIVINLQDNRNRDEYRRLIEGEVNGSGDSDGNGHAGGKEIGAHPIIPGGNGSAHK